MTRQEEYDLLVEMIDKTQRKIQKDPKDKLHLLQELKQLQNELRELQTSTVVTNVLSGRRGML